MLSKHCIDPCWCIVTEARQSEGAVDSIPDSSTGTEKKKKRSQGQANNGDKNKKGESP